MNWETKEVGPSARILGLSSLIEDPGPYARRILPKLQLVFSSVDKCEDYEFVKNIICKRTCRNLEKNHARVAFLMREGISSTCFINYPLQRRTKMKIATLCQ